MKNYETRRGGVKGFWKFIYFGGYRLPLDFKNFSTFDLSFILRQSIIPSPHDNDRDNGDDDDDDVVQSSWRDKGVIFDACGSGNVPAC